MKQKTKTKSPIWTVFFFGSRDYGFFGPDSIRPFNKVNVEKDLKAKKFKTKDLEMAVREALDPTLIEDREEEDEEEEDEGEEEEQEKAPQGKKKPKATGTATTGTTGKGGKKATSKTASASTKKTKAAAAATTKASSEEDADTQSVNSNNSNKRGVSDDDKADKKKRRKSMSIEKEDQQSNGSDRPSASPVTPRKSEDGSNKAHESLEITRDFKRLYHLRHRLQKLMYEKKQGEIPLDDYPKISSALKDVEEAPMTYDLLRHTKIGKVVKCGIGYEFENDTEYNIHERCQQLMRKWKDTFVDSKDQVKVNDTTDGQNKEPTSTVQG
ncbi:unnamed protein product [Absidia cylindrospora]